MQTKDMNNNIVLIGFMGTGKTTTGRLLAEKIQYNFCDTDLLIEEQCKMTIEKIGKIRYIEKYQKAMV
jgi:shikimate kinase